MSQGASVVTRFAPSPTGFMHIGGMRTALFAYLWAKKNDGIFILRIEDTDQERKVEGSIEHIQETLRWLDLTWDYGPDKPGSFGSVIQSERLSTYRDAAQTLVDRGLAYPDPYTSEQREAFRKEAQDAKRAFLFRNHRPTSFNSWDGKSPLRFKVPTIKRYQWHDEVRGDLEAGEEALDDFILMKSDGYPTYNFAHIIDDQAMGVNCVMRADEFISSTPRFLSLYDALEISYPQFVTLPPILRDDKTKKLGKRDGAKDILDYRTDGYLPDAMTNFLAFVGWNPGTEQELFSREELIAAFDIHQIQTHGGIINEDKLRWYNREYIKKMTVAECRAYIGTTLNEGLLSRDISAKAHVAESLIPLIQKSLELSGDLKKNVSEGEYDYFFSPPTLETTRIPEKKSNALEALRHLTYAHDALKDLAPWTSESLKEALWPYAEEHGRGAVLWPLRFSLTGRDTSSDPFTVASIIGNKETMYRIDHAISLLSPL